MFNTVHWSEEAGARPWHQLRQRGLGLPGSLHAPGSQTGVVQACKHTRTLLDVKSTQEAADGRILHCTGDLCTEVRGTDTTPSWEREGSHTDMHAHARVRAETHRHRHTHGLPEGCLVSSSSLLATQ